MNCPRCNAWLTTKEIKRLWGQLCRSLAGKVDPAKAKERAKKAADARWANAYVANKLNAQALASEGLPEAPCSLLNDQPENDE